MGLNLERYVSEFSAQNITGEQLLQLDGNKLKVRSSMSVLGHQEQFILLAALDMFSLDDSTLHICVVIFVNSHQKMC